MLYRPVAGFASYTGSVPPLSGPCCSQDSPKPVFGVSKHDHGRGQRFPSVRHMAVLEESSASLRAGRKVTEVPWDGSNRSSPWVPEHAGSLDSRAVAVATQSSIMLPAPWERRRSSPVLLESEGLGRREPLEVEGLVGFEYRELDEPEVSELSEPGGAEKVSNEENVAQVDRGDSEAESERANGAIMAQSSPAKKRVHPNKGRMPWNKGKRHSPETIARIRQRTIEAMCNPVIREKLRNCAVNQSDETKEKIRASIAANWKAKRLIRKSQEACLHEWKELIADGARIGGAGDGELQWDSYRTILKQLAVEEKERAKAMRKELQRKGSKQKERIAPAGSDEHRQKISAAIRAKWSDPDYRRKVSEGLQKFVTEKTGVSVRAPPKKRSPSNLPRVPKDPNRTGPKVNNTVSKPSQRPPAIPVRPSAVEEPYRHVTFVDPRASEKLERMRRIQAGRRMMELRKLEAAERARLLMAEAEKAANALEAVAVTDEAARLYLAETRRLLAEAADKMRTAESRR